jgi:hypothetical protein
VHRQLVLIDAGDLMALDCLRKFSETRSRILQRFDQKSRFLFVDPTLHLRDDVRLAQMAGSDVERFCNERRGILWQVFASRSVFVCFQTGAASLLEASLQQDLGFSDSRPAQEVDHLARDSGEKRRIGSLQEIE